MPVASVANSRVAHQQPSTNSIKNRTTKFHAFTKMIVSDNTVSAGYNPYKAAGEQPLAFRNLENSKGFL
jgi:hypothetical protein